MRRALVVSIVAAVLAVPAGASGQQRTDPPYNIPTAPTTTDTGPSIPLVAALTLPKGQKLGTVLRQGLALRIYAYKPIQFSVLATLAPATARRVHVRTGLLAIPRRVFQFTKPGVYQRRVRLSHRAITRLRRVKVARLQLRTALSSAGNRTSTISPITLSR